MYIHHDKSVEESFDSLSLQNCQGRQIIEGALHLPGYNRIYPALVISVVLVPYISSEIMPECRLHKTTVFYIKKWILVYCSAPI